MTATKIETWLAANAIAHEALSAFCPPGMHGWPSAYAVRVQDDHGPGSRCYRQLSRVGLLCCRDEQPADAGWIYYKGARR